MERIQGIDWSAGLRGPAAPHGAMATKGTAFVGQGCTTCATAAGPTPARRELAADPGSAAAGAVDWSAGARSRYPVRNQGGLIGDPQEPVAGKAFAWLGDADPFIHENQGVIWPDGTDWWVCYPDLRWGTFEDNNDEFDATVANPGRSTHEFVPLASEAAITALVADEAAYEAAVAAGDVNAMAPQEPFTVRLLLAVSSDGVNWVKTGMVVANHASVPCLAVEDGVLYLFFNILRSGIGSFTSASDDPDHQVDRNGTLGKDERTTPMAVASTTNLVNWAYRLIGDQGKGITYALDSTKADPDTILSGVDPSVVPAHGPDVNDGWYLYFTLWKSTGTGTYMAATGRLSDTISDGAGWKFRNDGDVIFPTPTDYAAGYAAADPTVLWVQSPTFGGYYQYYSGDVTDPLTTLGTNWSAQLASDGITVLSQTKYEQRCGVPSAVTGKVPGLLLSNGVEGAGPYGGHAWYGFVQDRDNGDYIVRLFMDEAGSVTTADPCEAILVVDRDYEHENVKDPAVVKFGDCYVMVYVSGIPLRSKSLRKLDVADTLGIFVPPQINLVGPPPDVIRPRPWWL